MLIEKKEGGRFRQAVDKRSVTLGRGGAACLTSTGVFSICPSGSFIAIVGVEMDDEPTDILLVVALLASSTTPAAGNWFAVFMLDMVGGEDYDVSRGSEGKEAWCFWYELLSIVVALRIQAKSVRIVKTKSAVCDEIPKRGSKSGGKTSYEYRSGFGRLVDDSEFAALGHRNVKRGRLCSSARAAWLR